MIIISITFITEFLNGDWGLGIGDWGLGIVPNHQSPIPNPQSPIPIKPKFFNINIYKIKLNIFI